MIDPKSSKTTGFHLFLEPAGRLADELALIIKNLSQEYGGPVFSPHVTLLARIPAEDEEVVAAKTKIFAQTTSPFVLTLAGPAIQDAFFKALYLQVAETEKMETLHAKANEIFSMADEGPYVPHLSLLYGNYERARREQTAATLPVSLGASFLVDRVHVYRTEGETKNWQKLEGFPFAS